MYENNKMIACLKQEVMDASTDPVKLLPEIQHILKKLEQIDSAPD
jgi:hypothetical protein